MTTPLARSVPCESPPRIGQLPRSHTAALWISRGVIGAVGLVVLSSAFAGPRMTHCFEGDANDQAKATVLKYAFEAYPAWAAQHLGRACPSSLDDLDEYMNLRRPVDPWGHRYLMRCASGPSTRGVFVGSAGEDGRFDTFDDLWSPP